MKISDALRSFCQPFGTPSLCQEPRNVIKDIIGLTNSEVSTMKNSDVVTDVDDLEEEVSNNDSELVLV